jgi:acetylglutamate kinase
MDSLYIIKIGGNIIDDEQKLHAFLKDFATIEGRKILVHGGGKLATRMAEGLQIPQQMVEGRRVTDAETLKIVTMVYAGYINKNIVASLQAAGCNAVGITGADGNTIQAHKRVNNNIDYGYVGDVDAVHTGLLRSILDNGMAAVVAPITHDRNGQLLNTNADTIAQELARELSRSFQTQLVYSFEKPGVLLDVDDENSLIPQMKKSYYAELKSKGAIFAGMIPKLDNAFAALEQGVTKVIIGKAENLPALIAGSSGTSIIHE